MKPYPVLDVEDLRKHFKVRGAAGGRELVAVDGIDLEVHAGETLALVGESGSGKSTVARCIVRLIEPTSGRVLVSGTPLARLGRAGLAKAYRNVQMVFQDPNSSLNPRMTVRRVIDEPLRLHLALARDERLARTIELLGTVGLDESFLDRLPHMLSGGQRQRIGIARALAVEPDVLILDEPTSSLDVSVRSQVLELLKDLQVKQNIAYLFITHDLQAVRHVADRVAVMYLGGIVEQGPTAEIFDRPLHPYTRALLSAAPVASLDPRPERFRLVGEIPSPIDVPPGCRLAGRCPLAEASCHVDRPRLLPVGPDHKLACPVVSRPTVDALAAQLAGAT